VIFSSEWSSCDPMAPPTGSFWTWVPPPGEAECRDRQISENDPKKGYLCVPALLSAQCLPMLLHEERAGPCLVPSNRSLHYRNTGMVTDPCSAPSRRVRTSVPRLMSHTPVWSNVWSCATRHSLKVSVPRYKRAFSGNKDQLLSNPC